MTKAELLSLVDALAQKAGMAGYQDAARLRQAIEKLTEIPKPKKPKESQR